MEVKKAAFGALLTIVAAYVVYPYVTLYRLGQAIRHGDATMLQSMVDWPSVREGIKEDICDLVIDEPPEAKHGGKLPPFGAGFVRGIAANAIDERVTPQALATVAKQPTAATGSLMAVPVAASGSAMALGSGCDSIMRTCGGRCGIGIRRGNGGL